MYFTLPSRAAQSPSSLLATPLAHGGAVCCSQHRARRLLALVHEVQPASPHPAVEDRFLLHIQLRRLQSLREAAARSALTPLPRNRGGNGRTLRDHFDSSC